MTKIMPQLIRTFASRGLGASERFVWRIVKEPTYSDLGSPIDAGATIDTLIWGITGTSTIDDSFDQTQGGGRMSPGKKIIHLRHDIARHYGQRSLLAGDMILRYEETTLDIIVAGAQKEAHIRPEADSITMVMTYDNVTQVLTDSDYTYDPIAGTIAFLVSIPDSAAIACSYCYDKYYIEDVNNYGKVYIEVILNKVSRT